MIEPPRVTWRAPGLPASLGESFAAALRDQYRKSLVAVRSCTTSRRKLAPAPVVAAERVSSPPLHTTIFARCRRAASDRLIDARIIIFLLCRIVPRPLCSLRL